MKDKDLKRLWNKVEDTMEASVYESETIEKFVANRSTSVLESIRRMLILDITLKVAFSTVFLVDAILYFGVQPAVFQICVAAILIAIPLVLGQLGTLRYFDRLTDYAQSTRERLSQTLTFLRTRSFTTILLISSTYIYIFVSGMLMYFFFTYGRVRPLDGIDFLVFSAFIGIGVVMNIVINGGQVKYHIKHIEACLSDLNDNELAVVTSNIETQRKQDQTVKVLLIIVGALGFTLLAILVKKLGF
jgi:hypothetical protein